ncbi:MAG TPA: VacB/RNase II family 3'-5' exoribonuclease [Thermoanaerobaculia bacterium]|jgi:ribonuclease R
MTTRGKRQDRWRGTISVHLRGFGFVDLDDAGAPADSAFVAPPDLNSFLADDVVDVTLESSGEGRYQAVDLKLARRPRSEVIGTVERAGQSAWRLAIDPRIGNTAWPLLATPKGLRPGASVVGAPDDQNRIRYLRSVEDDDVDRTTVLVLHRIRTEIDEATRAEAKGVRVRLEGRRDLRKLPTVTIDAAHSRDLDDALAVFPVQADGAIRVLVSIADVDAAVPTGSRLDAEARRRGTSVYLPDLVVNMLPPELSEDAITLRPGVDRAALTVELRIDREGEVTAADLSTSVIRSAARLTYVAVAAFLDRGETEGVPEEVRDTVGWLHAAASRLSAVRKARGGVTIEPDEVTVDLDEETGEPMSLDVREPTSAHLLVERLMVAANEAVARWLIDRGLPGLFRVQDPPEDEQVERLAEFAANFGFKTAFGGKITARALAAFEEQFRAAQVAPSLRTVMYWVLGRARYQAPPSPHYALAAPAYLHFTSPIRRYPDLVVHRVVKAHLAGKRDVHLGVDELATIAGEVNDAAYRAQKAERDRTRMLVARYFNSRVGQKHRGRIVAVKSFGLVVQLDELGVTGTVATETLGKGPWEIDKTTYSLVSNQRRYMIGEAVEVRVASTDEALGRVDLELR